MDLKKCLFILVFTYFLKWYFVGLFFAEVPPSFSLFVCSMAKLFIPLLDFCVTKPKVIFAVIGLVCLICAAQLPFVKIDTDPENMLDSAHPARVFHNQVKQTFSMHDAIVVGLVPHDSSVYTPANLSAIYDITQSILTIEGVIEVDVMSLSTVDNITQAGPGTIRFEWMMNQAQISETRAEQIQRDVSRLPMLYDTLVAKTERAIAIYVPIKDKNQSYRIAQQIRQLTEKKQSLGDWYITGLPVAEDQFGVEMFLQMGISAPLAGLTIFILLFVFFRNIPLIIAPMIVAMATVIIVMGALIGAGFTVHIMSSMIAIFLMPIAVVDSVHILSEFSERYKKVDNINHTIEQVIGHLFTPMLYTSLTSAVGFYSLLLTPIPPVQIFGFFVGTGILLAFLLTVTLIPAYIATMSPKTLNKLALTFDKSNISKGKVAAFTDVLGRVAKAYKGALIVAFTVIFVLSAWGVTLIQINDNPVRWFKPNHEIRQADKALNEQFAGTYNAYLVLQQTQTYIDIEKLLSSAPSPSSLDAWIQQTPLSINQLPSEQQAQELLLLLDDALFYVTDGEEIEYLQTIKTTLEGQILKAQVFLSKEALDYVEQLQDYLRGSGLVGKSNSVVDIVKTVNRELHSGEEAYFVTPRSAYGVSQVLLQYQSSHRPQDLWHFVTPDYRSALVWLQLTSGDNQDMSQVIDLVDDYVEQNPLPDGMTLNWAGKAYLNVVWQDNMVSGMLNSLLGAFGIVFVMMIILFRSIKFGLLAMLPLSFTICFIYGLIGFVGKDYDMPIAVLSALTLGLSVDFAIHFIERARAIYRQTGDLPDTMRQMFNEPASAIVRNAVVIAIGFTPLLLAPLVPYITVGFFLVSIMAVSALVTLLILPSIIYQFQRFIFEPPK